MAKKRRERRTFTEKFKKEIVDRVVAGERVTDLAEKYNIQASQISMWKRKITGKPGKRGRKPGSKNRPGTAAPGAAAPATSTPSAAAPRAAASSAPTVSKNDAYIKELEDTVGRLTIENLRLRAGR